MAFPTDLSDRLPTVAITNTITHDSANEQYGGLKAAWRLGDLVSSSTMPTNMTAISNPLGVTGTGSAAAALALAKLMSHYSTARFSSITGKFYRNGNASAIPDDPAGTGVALIIVYEVVSPSYAPDGAKQVAIKIPHFTGDVDQARTDFDQASVKALINPVSGVTSVTLIDAKAGGNFRR